jgi:hypothetical protein
MSPRIDGWSSTPFGRREAQEVKSRIARSLRRVSLAVGDPGAGYAPALALLALGAGGLVAPAFAQAQDLGNSQRVQSTAEVSSVEVGDVAGHVVGVIEFKGLTFFADGEIATHSNPATFDLTNGSGPHQGYVIHYFDDGSTSTERYRGEARLSADGKRTTVEGTFECVGGTGRFAGLKGQGTYRGERLGALQTGDYVYVDTTGSCTAP